LPVRQRTLLEKGSTVAELDVEGFFSIVDLRRISSMRRSYSEPVTGFNRYRRAISAGPFAETSNRSSD
jgi:hypothetical protein